MNAKQNKALKSILLVSISSDEAKVLQSLIDINKASGDAKLSVHVESVSKPIAALGKKKLLAISGTEIHPGKNLDWEVLQQFLNSPEPEQAEKKPAKASKATKKVAKDKVSKKEPEVTKQAPAATKYVPGYTSRPLEGRAKFVRQQFASGVEISEALVETQKRFNCSEKAFMVIWNSAQSKANAGA